MIYSRLKKQEESVKCAEAAECDGYYVEAAKIYSAIGKRDAAVSLAKKTEGMRLRVTAWEIYRELGMWVEAANLVNEGRTANFHQRGSFSHND